MGRKGGGGGEGRVLDIDTGRTTAAAGRKQPDECEATGGCRAAGVVPVVAVV